MREASRQAVGVIARHVLPLDAGKVHDEAAGRQVGALEAWVVAPYVRQLGVGHGGEIVKRDAAGLRRLDVDHGVENVAGVLVPIREAAGIRCLVVALGRVGEGVLRCAAQF